LTLVVLLAVLLFAAFSSLRARAEGSTSMSAPQLQQTTVAPGESLWSVAQRIAPGRDPRPVVDQIRRLNHLPGVGVQAGQQLLLPSGH
jgi:LysM repeat protein